MEYYTSSTTISSSGSEDLGAFLSIGAGVLIFIIIFSIALYILTSISLGKMFKKAGIESWIAWVPIYNMWKMFEMGDKNGALILTNLIPGVGQIIFLVLSLIVANNIAKKFGKGIEYLFIYLLLSPLWFVLLGFSKNAVWNGGSNQVADNNNIPVIDQQPVYGQPEQFQPQAQNSYQQPVAQPQQTVATDAQFQQPAPEFQMQQPVVETVAQQPTEYAQAQPNTDYASEQAAQEVLAQSQQSALNAQPQEIIEPEQHQYFN